MRIIRFEWEWDGLSPSEAQRVIRDTLGLGHMNYGWAGMNYEVWVRVAGEQNPVLLRIGDRLILENDQLRLERAST